MCHLLSQFPLGPASGTNVQLTTCVKRLWVCPSVDYLSTMPWRHFGGIDVFSTSVSSRLFQR